MSDETQVSHNFTSLENFVLIFQTPTDNTEADLNIDEELENLMLDENIENVSKKY